MTQYIPSTVRRTFGLGSKTVPYRGISADLQEGIRKASKRRQTEYFVPLQIIHVVRSEDERAVQLMLSDECEDFFAVLFVEAGERLVHHQHFAAGTHGADDGEERDPEREHHVARPRGRRLLRTHREPRFLPPESRFRTVEFEHEENVPAYEKADPYFGTCRKIIDSDAHYLENISEAVHVLHVEENSPEGILRVLKGCETAVSLESPYYSARRIAIRDPDS